ncbi:MAG TPA: response regulator [Candidatus Saccharimonadales bacterium]|nr:response regulator [Candidatus Saccharimonadales bacterium]
MAQILLIEPDRLLARIYFECLTQAGHQVQICATAQSAIFCADDIAPDVVVLELQLVAHSGVEFLYEFRSYPDWQNIPVIANTNVPAGEFSGSWQLLRDQLGVAQYLYKPVTNLQKLLSTVNEFAAIPAEV